jgi:hypothetical protein
LLEELRPSLQIAAEIDRTGSHPEQLVSAIEVDSVNVMSLFRQSRAELGKELRRHTL